MKKVFFVFLLIFSLLIISGKEYRCEYKENLLVELESYVMDKYEFVQNGIKVEYLTCESIENEYKRIKELFDKKENFTTRKDKNNISCKGENINYSVNVYSYKGKVKVDIELLNNNSDLMEKDLIILAKEIMGSNFLDDRYFSFIKGKIKTDDKKILSDIENELDIEFEEVLDISNGCIAKANMKGKKDINIGQINYDTGSYLIIGTPIIFITY